MVGEIILVFLICIGGFVAATYLMWTISKLRWRRIKRDIRESVDLFKELKDI